MYWYCYTYLNLVPEYEEKWKSVKARGACTPGPWGPARTLPSVRGDGQMADRGCLVVVIEALMT